jgi:hypothetical protein
MKDILTGILFILIGIIVIIIDLKFPDDERADYRGISGAIISIMIGFALLFGFVHL